MKFNEYINLMEDGEGGGSEPIIDTGNEPEATPPSNTTSNMAGWTPPIGFISRLKMPQIAPGLYPDFLADLNNNNINHKKCSYQACQLMPTQNEFNDDKVNAIRLSKNDGSYKEPILVAGNDTDIHIVDGHHRWKAHDAEEEIETHHVDLPFDDLYKFLQNKYYVLNRDKKQKKKET